VTSLAERPVPAGVAVAGTKRANGSARGARGSSVSKSFAAGRRHLGRLGLLITMFCLLFPVYWLVQSSFSTQLELFHTPAYLFPPHPSLQGFRDAWPVISGDLWHSAVIAMGTVVVTLFVAITAGYGILLARVRSTAALVRLLVLVGLVFPTIMFVIPLYSLLYHLHLLNTYPGLILADSLYSVPLGVLILYTYMITLPHELTEAANVDGASSARVLWSVVIPMTRPAVATTAIFAFLGAWGDFLFAETFTDSDKILPASIGIYNLVSNSATDVVSWPEVMAGCLILGAPALLAVILAQRYIRSGISTGAVTG
jgi:multiple sugar transport system permease protein